MTTAGWFAIVSQSIFAACDRRIAELNPPVGGMVIVTRHFVDGELEREERVLSVTEKELPPETFEPPEGYQAIGMGE